MEPGPDIAILVVDDRASQRRALEVVVEGLAEVVEASSGREALRLVLQRDFAVILLDVNMPGMDGFETASIIRQRKRSEHTPIIFVTAYGDESHAARGYRLGAVDYIQSPIDAQVLRTKVSVFVELYRRTGEARRYAESLRRRASQLRRLADLSMAVHEASEVDALLETVATAAAEIVDAEQVGIETDVDSGSAFARGEGGGQHVVRKPPDGEFDLPRWFPLFESGRRVVRLPAGSASQMPSGGAAPAERSSLAVPLLARDGRVHGALHVAGKRGGDFDGEDEDALLQVAQLASIALENTLFKDAQEANRLKDQFLATLSHELRTPLQAMLSWGRILRDDASDPEVLARGLEVIERSASAQQKLIDDLLDVSRIVTGKLRLELDAVALASVIDSAVDEARAAAEAKGVALGLRSAPGLPLLMGDAHRLKQVIGNLLSNAIHFTPRGGRIDVSLRRDADCAHIRVTDSGEGIAPEFLPHVFERFRQADSSSTRSHTGLGIGLAIVRHLVELHGGSVRAESAGKGQGASFHVLLPLREVAIQRSPPASDSRLGAGESDNLHGIRVLLVDDVDETRECVALILRRRGAEVTSVASADAAFSALALWSPHVLVSDIAMPGRDGISLIEELRGGDAVGSRIPAAALSAYARPEERQRALRAGFDMHLAKPVREDTLVAGVLALARLSDGPAPARAL
ncbi:MAG TPA: response regulator [Myxococcota bacterium]|nr:response regulator [Myxococcota bacterium]